MRWGVCNMSNFEDRCTIIVPMVKPPCCHASVPVPPPPFLCLHTVTDSVSFALVLSRAAWITDWPYVSAGAPPYTPTLGTPKKA